MANDNSFNINSSNFNLVIDQVPTVIHHKKPLVDISLPEDKETDAFLNEDLSVSKGPASSVYKESRLHKKKGVENIVQDVFDFTVDGSEKNHITEILLTGREENNCQESIDEIMIKEKVGTKKAKGLIYDFILVYNSDTKRKTLYQHISRARKVYEFTEKIGIDKIKYIKTRDVPCALCVAIMHCA
ncbi:hypothetical protein C1646_822289 [Rhizophagus diaphanus]|nr:hypothetical protein C1646_822289 [Rhizophagus diaphanus] [Rhizophagus sp. MUCL 43196]